MTMQQAPRAGSTSEWHLGLLLAFVVLAWALNWVLMKVAVAEITPLWAVAVRTIIAAMVLVPAQILTGDFIVPPRHDIPIVLVISLLHMTAFAALMTAGLKLVPAGRTIVLGYTTPLWVAPGAFLFLGEPIRRLQAAGIALGLLGLLLLYDPSSFDWTETQGLVGNGCILLAAICWAASMLYTRAHRWTATPFQLILWQLLLAAAVLSILAFIFEPIPKFDVSGEAVIALLYNGAVGTALGFWAMTVVNKEMPAVSGSVGLLATPIVGIGLSALILGEPLSAKLLLSAGMIFGGILLGLNWSASSASVPGARESR